MTQGYEKPNQFAGKRLPVTNGSTATPSIWTATESSMASEQITISSLLELSDRVTQILSAVYGVNADRSIPVTSEIRSWKIDGYSFESNAKTFAETLAQPKTLDHMGQQKTLTLQNALEVIFDQQGIMDSNDIEQCWKTVVASLIMVNNGRLNGKTKMRGKKELHTWLNDMRNGVTASLAHLGVNTGAREVTHLTKQLTEFLLQWQHLVHSFNVTDMCRIAHAMKNHLQGQRVNPKTYWSRRRLTYDFGK